MFFLREISHIYLIFMHLISCPKSQLILLIGEEKQVQELSNSPSVSVIYLTKKIVAVKTLHFILNMF